MLRDQLIR